jgi:hypothetical protein
MSEIRNNMQRNADEPDDFAGIVGSSERDPVLAAGAPEAAGDDDWMLPGD